MSQIKLKVTDIQQLTAQIKMFEFKSADGGQLPTWAAGSHVDFQIGDNSYETIPGRLKWNETEGRKEGRKVGR